MRKNISTIFLTSLATTIVLASCVVGKKYTPTSLEIPDKYREEITLTADTILLPWRTFFKDPQLVTLIEKALQKNNDVSVALKTMEQMDLAMQQAKKSLLPMVQATVGANRSYPSKNSLNGSLTEQFIGTKYIDDFSASLGISWEADIWRKAKMQKDQALANYFAQKENLSALKTRIISNVAQAYYNLLSLDAQLKVAKQNVELSDSTLAMMHLQYNSGLINSVAIGQTEAQKKTAELIIPLAKQNITVQENALSILCGSYPDAISRASSFDSFVLDDSFSAGVPAQLLSRRPDVKAAEYAVIALNAKTGLAKANMYPSISLSAQITANSYKFNQWFDLPGSLAKNLVANLTAPIFQKGALKTEYKTALIEQEKAVIQFRQTVLNAVSEVSDAMAKSKGASDRLALTHEKGIILEKTTRDALLLYNSGMATYLEVLTAQNSRLQNDLESTNIRLEKFNSVVDLYKSLGGGVEQ